MGYSKTNWQNLPNQSTPLSANNLNKIENELEKLDPETPYISVNGTYTTATWSEGTATNCTWTAPRSGLYIIFAYFSLDSNFADAYAKVYKQFQLRGTAIKLVGSTLIYQHGADSHTDTETIHKSIIGYQGSTLISATQGDTIIPYIHTPEAGTVWNVKLVGLFLK